MAFLLLDPLWQALDSNGKPLPGAKLYVYDAGTTDDAGTYQDTALSSAHAQPVVANSAGRFANIYVAGGQSYKVVLTTSADASVLTSDNIPPGRQVSGTLSINEGGTNATTASGALTSLGAASATDMSKTISDLATIKGNYDTVIPGGFGAMAGKASVGLTDLASGFHEICVQTYYAENIDGTTLDAIPRDDTIPQITEGTEIFSKAFTPLYADSIIEIECIAHIGPPTSNTMCILALFSSSSSNAIQVSYAPGLTSASYSPTIIAKRRVTSGSTTARTYSVRAGCSSGTATLNSYFDTANASTFIIREYKSTPIT